MATYDADQNIVCRSLNECPQYLEKNGRVVLGYSDHSDPEGTGKPGKYDRGGGTKNRRYIEETRPKSKPEAQVGDDSGV